MYTAYLCPPTRVSLVGNVEVQMTFKDRKLATKCLGPCALGLETLHNGLGNEGSERSTSTPGRGDCQRVWVAIIKQSHSSEGGAAGACLSCACWPWEEAAPGSYNDGWAAGVGAAGAARTGVAGTTRTVLPAP